jgi:LPS-assembly protein
MTDKLMRRLSAGAMLSVLLVVGALLWGPLSKAAVAQSGITIGFAVDGTGLVDSSSLAEELGRYIGGQLAIPVKARSFLDEDQLQNRLIHLREVDVAWLNEDFLAGRPAGELYPLVRNSDSPPSSLSGQIVALQEMNVVLLQQLRVVFLGMNESPVGRGLLAQLGIDHFVAPEREQSLGVVSVSEPQAKETILREVKAEATTEATTKPASVRSLAQSKALVPDEVPSAAQAAVMGETSSPKSKKVSSAVQSGINQETPIALVADYLAYNAEEKSYEARGDVALRQADVELKSEELFWQAVTQDATARGSVQLNDAGAEVSGESMRYNMATGQGQVSAGRVLVHDGNFHLSGDQIEKYGQADYLVKNGSFTTCDGEVPDWKFSAREVDVTLGEYARAKDVWFHIKDVPVFYTPYLMFPVATERESGLLMPRFGYSNNKGAIASMAWYQVIDRNMDATLYLDYFSEIGLGKGLEYRYTLAGHNNGKALYYHVTGLGEIEEQGQKEDSPDLDYYRWEHGGNLPGDWRLMADIEYTDRKLFFEEFGEFADEYNRDTTVSTLMLSRNWQKLNFVSYARYIQDLDTGSDDTTLQRLPEVGLSQVRYRLGDTPLYAGLESSATRFWSKDGEDGDRLFLKPSLSAFFKPGSWLEVVPEVALYERLYNADTEDEEQFLPEFSLSLSTKLLKAFDVNLWGFQRIQHSIEPKVTYTYVPDESQDNLPLFDLSDRIENLNVISYSLVNRLTSRSIAADGSSVYREILNLRLSQWYDLDEEERALSGDARSFSDVRVELDINPTKNLSFDAKSLIPVYGDNGINSLTVGSMVKDDHGNAAKVDYTYKDQDFAGDATDYVRLQVDTSILQPVYARFEERYDFYKGRELEKFLGLEYRAKCWSLLLTYRNRNGFDGEDDDHEIGLTFVLSGLGQNQGYGNGFGKVRQ